MLLADPEFLFALISFPYQSKQQAGSRFIHKFIYNNTIRYLHMLEFGIISLTALTALFWFSVSRSYLAVRGAGYFFNLMPSTILTYVGLPS
jgi:hypothetical protein